MYGRILKRFCHHHDRNIAQFLKPYNPLVECEKAPTVHHFENTNPPSIEETKTCIENNNFIHDEINCLPIQIQYVDNNNKIHKILVHLTK